MRIHSHLFSAVAALGLLIGCASVKEARPTTVAVAIVSDDGISPSPQHVTAIHRALAPHVAARGYALAMNPATADLIMHVRFSADPGGGGRLSFIGFEGRNAMRQAAAGSPFPSAMELLHDAGSPSF